MVGGGSARWHCPPGLQGGELGVDGWGNSSNSSSDTRNCNECQRQCRPWLSKDSTAIS